MQSKVIKNSTSPENNLGAGAFFVCVGGSLFHERTLLGFTLTLNKRVELGYMGKEAFQVLAKETKSCCVQCQNGELIFEEYKKWLDKTSRQRKITE